MPDYIKPKKKKKRYAKQPSPKTSNYEWKLQREAEAKAKKKADQERRAKKSKEEKLKLLNEIEGIGGVRARDIAAKQNLTEVRQLAEKWREKGVLLKGLRSSGLENANDIANYLVDNNPPMDQWKTVAKSFRSGDFNPEQKSVLSQGYEEMEEFARRGVVSENPGDFSQSQREFLANNPWDRQRYVSSSGQVGTRSREWTQAKIFDDFVSGLLKDPDLTDNEIEYLNSVRLNYGHQGAASIPGYRSRSNYLGNIQAELADLNRSSGSGMTVTEVINAHDNMLKSGGAVTLDPDAYLKIAEFIEESELGQDAPKGVLSLQVLDRIEDPLRQAINEKDRVAKQGLLYTDRWTAPGSWPVGVRKNPATRLLAFEEGLTGTFDAGTQRAIVIPANISQAEIARIRALPKEVTETLVDRVRDQALKSSISGEPLDQVEIVNRAARSMPEDMQKLLKQGGFSNPKMLAAVAAVGAVSLPLMSEQGRAYALDKGIGLLNKMGEWEQQGMGAIQQAVPGAAQVGQAYNQGIGFLNWGKGQQTSAPVVYDESGQPTGGGSWNAQKGLGDYIDIARQFILPVEDAGVMVGVMQPEFSRVDSGGGGF